MEPEHRYARLQSFQPCTWACMYSCVHMYTCVYTRVHMCPCRVYTRVHMCPCHVCTHCICAPVMCVLMCTCARHVYTRVHMCPCHVCTHVHICPCHVCTCVHMCPCHVCARCTCAPVMCVHVPVMCILMCPCVPVMYVIVCTCVPVVCILVFTCVPVMCVLIAHVPLSCVYSCAHVSLPRGALTFMCTHFPSSPILNSGWWWHQPRGPQPNTQTSLVSPFFPSSPSRSLTMVSQCLNISQSHLLPVLPHPHPSQRAVPTPPTLHTVATRMTFPSHKFYLTSTPLKTLPGSLIKQDIKLLLLLLLLLSRFSRVRLCATP